MLDSGFVVFALAYLLMNIPAGMYGTFKSEIVASLGTSLDELVNLYSISEYCYAGMLIPASLLIVRFSPGTLAWVAIALEALGLGIRWFAHEPTLFFVGMIVSNAGWALAIPLVGQIARNRLSTRVFVIATTAVFCLGQGLQAMFPYFYAFIIGLSLYMVLGRLHHLLHRQEKLERLQHTTVDS